LSGTRYACAGQHALAFPLSAAANDKAAVSASANSANDGGAEAMLESLDKNRDGFLSRDEVKGTPHEAEFAQLDKNGDNKLSRPEHAAAPEHMAARARGGTTGSTSGTADTSGAKKY
jgi:EF hand domain-containing protein